MPTLTLTANAKLNLSLDITGLRDDGYHLLDSVMQSISLSDEITVGLSRESGIRITSNFRYLPTDGRNLVHKAATRLAEAVGKEDIAVAFHIKKRIPSQSGMGGGSADAAAALIALRELWDLDLSDRELAGIGLSVGADIPFCLCGGTRRVQGIGEVICDAPQLKDCCFAIVMPKFGNSTKEIFKLYDTAVEPERPNTEALLGAIRKNDLSSLGSSLKNVLDSACGDPRINGLKRELLDCGALGASMSGSGSAVFGVFPDFVKARRAASRLRSITRFQFLACPAARGVEKKTL